MIEFEQQDSVGILKMVRGKGNSLNIEFTQALTEALDEAEASAASAIVLTGEGKVFSAGVDLVALTSGGPEAIETFLHELTRFLRRMATFPKPIIAAVNGHAIAGGCVALLACDYRIMAQGTSRIGVTELLVGVPFPTWAFEIVRFGIPSAHLADLCYSGRTVEPDEALRLGLIDEVTAPDALLGRACKVAGKLGRVPGEVFALTKQQLRRPMLVAAEQRAPLDDAGIMKIWSKDSTQARIQEFVAQTVKRS